jgi:signal transduction histidine kinase
MQKQADILLVDDKAERLLSYEAVLERLEQNLVRANSGEEALAKLDETDFAAVLLDVNMPGMDGFETAARIRAHPRGRRTPIIFVTGLHVTDLDRLKGYEMGAADYIYVPVVPEILRGKVQVLVELYLQRQELSRLNERLVTANAELADAHEKLKAENTRELQRLNQSLKEANVRLESEVLERRRAEQLLREAAQRKDEFISILGHELRNPIAVIQTGIELMRQPSLPASKLSWCRDTLERQVRHLVRLIDDLLDVSRLTTGRVQLRRERIDLREIVQQSIETLRPAVDKRGHRLQVEVPNEPLPVNADPVRVTQICVNLLENAVKYMDEGGEIVVRVAPAAEDPGRAVLRITDKGVGLPADMLDRIFELFTQFESSQGHGRGGLGIGLALVRRLVELHGGSVRAFSEGPGRGAEFVVELPLLESVPRPANHEPDVSPGIGPALRLLIIDDNIDAAVGLALQFEINSRHELRVAHSGSSGVAMAMEFEPDVVLLDIGLPDIDGYEVARQLRKHPDLGSVPLIAMTGFGDQPHLRRAREAGFDHFLVKPVAYPDLEKVLAGCSARHTLTRTR